MKNLNEYVNESKKIVSSQCKDYSFDWIAIKDRWASRAEAKTKYSLVCYPNDKSKDIIVFKDYAWYTRGYDQGHASSYNYYLNTIIGGERGNGHGLDKEYEPFSGDLENDMDCLDEYLKTGKFYSTFGTERLDKAKIEFPPKTKVSDMKKRLDGRW